MTAWKQKLSLPPTSRQHGGSRTKGDDPFDEPSLFRESEADGSIAPLMRLLRRRMEHERPKIGVSTYNICKERLMENAGGVQEEDGTRG